MMFALIFAVAAAAPNLDAQDDANLAYTSCQFAVMRSHSARNAAPNELAAALSGRCPAEEARLRATTIEALVARGERRGAAAAEVNALIAGERARMVEEYARFRAFDASGTAQ